jgi:hypothetical protein
MPPEAIEDTEFVAEFEALRLPLERWHHREHIKLAYLYLRRYEFDGALERLRSGIRAHNAARGIPDELHSGYPETMTQAWLRLVHAMLLEYGPAPSAGEFYEQHPELSQKKSLRLFYSRDRFMSREAMHEFLEPDLAPLPGPTGL